MSWMIGICPRRQQTNDGERSHPTPEHRLPRELRWLFSLSSLGSLVGFDALPSAVPDRWTWMDDELPYRIPCCSEINTARHPINPFLSIFHLPSLPALPDPWTHREIGPRDPDRWLLHGASHKRSCPRWGIRCWNTARWLLVSSALRPVAAVG